jgi:AcrR family transcriptional regulator
MTDSKNIWIRTGYYTFAHAGAGGLKIEPLARKVKISKSSFYHYFADAEVFLEELLVHHIQQSYIIAGKEKQAQRIEPELIDILVEHKTDLLFNRQLRIHREQPQFLATLTKSNQIIGDAFVYLWIKDLQVNLSQKQLEGIFELALENFYLQITPDNLTPVWLAAYFNNLKRIIRLMN